MITFKNDTELNVVSDYDYAADMIKEPSNETFRKGEPVDAEVIEHVGAFVTLQFGDGSVAFGVRRDCFEIVENK